MEDPNQEPTKSEGGGILDPATGLPVGPQPEMVNIKVPAGQSSVVIPPTELMALIPMTKAQRMNWAANKKCRLGKVIDAYVQRAALASNGHLPK